MQLPATTDKCETNRAIFLQKEALIVRVPVVSEGNTNGNTL